jgi:hypothetical protein
MMELNEEDKENLREMLDNGTWESIEKVCAIALRNLEVQFLTAPLDKGEREVFLRAARYDGAKEVTRVIADVQTKIRRAKK